MEENDAAGLDLAQKLASRPIRVAAEPVIGVQAPSNDFVTETQSIET